MTHDFYKWSTLIIHPTFWWRLKALFICPEITFCWGEDKYLIKGLTNADCLSIGGVPEDVRRMAE